MSSLAAARADNFYNPPDWDPSKISRDKYQNSKGSNQYEQRGEIRFEMPWNIWCTSCKSHIGRGVRYNAKKIHHSMYFSTKIWEFVMKCHICRGVITIRTDPKTCDYLVISGGKRQATPSYTQNELDILNIKDDAHRDRMENDPIYKLQHEKEDKIKQNENINKLYKLKDIQEREFNDYNNNCLLRKKFRKKKKKNESLINIANKKGLNVKLLEYSHDDIKKSKNIKFQNKYNINSLSASKKLKLNKFKLKNESIFKKSNKSNKKKKKIKIDVHKSSKLLNKNKNKRISLHRNNKNDNKISKQQQKAILIQRMRKSKGLKANSGFSVDLNNLKFSKKR